MNLTDHLTEHRKPPFALFKEWLNQAKTAETEPMDEQLANVFTTIVVGVQTKEEELNQHILETISEEQSYRVVSARLKYLGFESTPSLLATVVMVCDSVGELVMYAHILASTDIEKSKKLDIHNLIEVFPTGFLTSKAKSVLWGAQKIGGDNLLDLIGPEAFN